jgi:hypothetical protein
LAFGLQGRQQLGRRQASERQCEQEAGVRLGGWIAYARFGNTYKLRSRVSEKFGELF